MGEGHGAYVFPARVVVCDSFARFRARFSDHSAFVSPSAWKGDEAQFRDRGLPARGGRRACGIHEFPAVFRQPEGACEASLARKEGEERYRFKADNELVLFPESEEFRAHLRYNGHEAVFWYPGLPFLYFGPAERLPGEACRYKLTLWNMGDMAWVSYVTLSFPGSESVSVGNVAGGRMYRRGAKIYHMPSRSYRPASDPMYEITKKSWKSRHRMEVEFGCPLGGLALVRVAIRHMGEARLSPAAELSAPVRLDQQGYPAYVYRLEK